MKIGLINDYPSSTGIGNYAFSLFFELKKKGEDVDMLYLQSKETAASMEGMRVITTPYKLPFLRRSFNWYYYFPKRIPKGYDVYHASNQYLSKVAEYRSPCVVSCMDIFPAILKKDYPFPIGFMLEKALQSLRKADAVITISQYSKKELVNKLSIPEEKVKVVYLGVDTNVFKPMDKATARKKLGLPQNKKIILHVGSEETRKNISGLFKAFYALQKKIPESLLLRVGEKRSSSWKLIRQLGLEGKVRYFSRLSSDDLVSAYNASDIFVFPSYCEGFGLPVLEAMASGQPVVASNTSSLPEILGDSGLMVDPSRYKDLSTAIHTVLTDKNLYNHLVNNGLKNAAGFSWKRTALETSGVYEEVWDGE